MSRTVSKLILSSALFSLAACDLGSTVVPSNGNGSGTGSNGTGSGTTGTGSGTTDTGTGSGTTTPQDEFVAVSIAEALTQGTTALHAVSISNATVVAIYEAKTNGSPNGKGTFYIQDGSGPGLAVYRGFNDTSALPKLGDKVNVKGHFTKYNGIFEIVGKTGTAAGVTYSHPLTIEVLESGTAPAPETFDPAKANDTDMIGHVVKIDGPLEITDADALVMTSTADGGTTTRPAGFKITGDVLVNDTYVYYDCIKPLQGGVGGLSFPNGIRGVWDRYQDYWAGSAQERAPTVPVLYPMSCEDLNP